MQKIINISDIPKEILEICKKLQENSFDSYIVGGCVRDLVISCEPKDFDITTNATPEEIIKIFGKDDTVYENIFGTVSIKQKDKVSQETVGIVEVTTYRKEGEYKDFRRPSKLEWGKTIEEDLMRRDFTMNSIAFDPIKDILIDPFNGIKDIKDKTINCVGNPEERFNEDSLRMLRAIRFSSQLEFVVGSETMQAIFNLSDNLKNISHERIRDEFIKILMTDDPMTALIISQKLGILKFISHEIEKGVGVDQNQAHKFDVYEHNLRTMQHAATKGWPLHIRLAALFHDISKPETRRWSKEKKDWTFYGHDVVGSRVSREIMTRLKFDKDMIETVSTMVRWHMFFSDTEKITLSAVRRLISNVGENRVWDLMDLRICDRIGTGRPKESPYRFRVYKSMVEQALTEPISLKMLKINGQKIMSLINESPSPKIGLILNALFNEVLDNPEKNNEDYLSNRVFELSNMSNIEIKKLSEEGKDKMKEENENQVKEIRKKFKV